MDISKNNESKKKRISTPLPEQNAEQKRLFASYMHGITDMTHGEHYSTILRYFLPEFITTMVLYSILHLLDARWIADLKSTSAYATSGVTNTLFHFIIKMAEGFSVGTTVMVGQYNGLGDIKKVGRTVVDAFWLTVIVGGIISFSLYAGAYWIYYFYGVPEKMITLGIPFLQLRALGIFFMFVYFAFVGFLRGIKNPKIPMAIYLIGAIAFVFFDYALIFGKFGFPQMRLQGSALASVLQYGIMLIVALVYIFFWKENRKYGISLLSGVSDLRRFKDLLRLSWPIMLDKSTLAFSYIWLGFMINPMGKYAIASYTVIKDLERFAIQPAAAFASVVTFLVSNAYSVQDWQGIKSNIKKIVFLSSVFVFSILLVFSLWPESFIQFFDLKGKFTHFASGIFPLLSVLVFFDLLQLILSGALRGAANVRAVMYVRLAVCVLYFFPISWLLSQYQFGNDTLKFVLLYGSFYLGSGLMSVIYINRFRGKRWQKKSI